MESGQQLLPRTCQISKAAGLSSIRGENSSSPYIRVYKVKTLIKSRLALHKATFVHLQCLKFIYQEFWVKKFRFTFIHISEYILSFLSKIMNNISKLCL